MNYPCFVWLCARYDEESWSAPEDDSEKRRKEFGDFFRRQMSMRKVGPLVLPSNGYALAC